ncbi:hypothetical protein M2459_003615 [Parabacteroides sp. PF5-5]|uniref:hypothetical protein n=1 Tax=unclassified Parabacteroides TaxID=2649774 RepID=UPI002476F736|nr:MULTISPECIES: hypothetical protein [unclassified Parabacteroides]MDH6306952.1 hypothetical protein [Parabacteroides sp. PH5-39]MDH6317826.1 hypothetical protein [Parabacteroides sp. PF5-13]MDH6321557.1 hypothetical protein [Parabacteroides sp. PH5-13]MDH6325367.1 hypothetical protein [Parabacteroides sp. PH5-8]MDH6329038.1 hypothetical protein [Parabacteroides sp. PH5-41]
MSTVSEIAKRRILNEEYRKMNEEYRKMRSACSVLRAAACKAIKLKCQIEAFFASSPGFCPKYGL